MWVYDQFLRRNIFILHAEDKSAEFFEEDCLKLCHIFEIKISKKEDFFTHHKDGSITLSPYLLDLLLSKEVNELDWTFIDENLKFSFSPYFLRFFSNKLTKELISLDREFIEMNKDKLHWLNLVLSYDLNESFIEEYSMYLNWNELIQFQRVSFNLLKKYSYLYSKESLLGSPFLNLASLALIDYSSLSKEKISELLIASFSLENLDKYQKEICWKKISEEAPLNKEIIDLYVDNIDFYRLSKSRHLTPDIVKAYMDVIQFSNIIFSEALTEELIRAFPKEFTEYYKAICDNINGRENISFKKEILYRYKDNLTLLDVTLKEINFFRACKD